jgi:hypothetical protein
MMDNKEDYLEAECERVSKLYSKKHKKGFPTKDFFIAWYSKQKQIRIIAAFTVKHQFLI